MKIGMLGGTFNPIHTGHLILAQECWHRFSLDKVIFIPAYVPPHKAVEEDTSAVDRLEMVRLSLEGDDRFGLSTYEIEKKGTSYTIDTIKHFKEKYGQDTAIFFLTGSDWAEGLSTWKEADSILDLATFVIGERPGWEESRLHGNDQIYHKTTRIVIPHVGISSTMIRDRVKNKEPIDYLVPPPVVRYISDKGLYKP